MTTVTQTPEIPIAYSPIEIEAYLQESFDGQVPGFQVKPETVIDIGETAVVTIVRSAVQRELGGDFDFDSLIRPGVVPIASVPDVGAHLHSSARGATIHKQLAGTCAVQLAFPRQRSVVRFFSRTNHVDAFGGGFGEISDSVAEVYKGEATPGTLTIFPEISFRYVPSRWSGRIRAVRAFEGAVHHFMRKPYNNDDFIALTSLDMSRNDSLRAEVLETFLTEQPR